MLQSLTTILFSFFSLPSSSTSFQGALLNGTSRCQECLWCNSKNAPCRNKSTTLLRACRGQMTGSRNKWASVSDFGLSTLPVFDKKFRLFYTAACAHDHPMHCTTVWIVALLLRKNIWARKPPIRQFSTSRWIFDIFFYCNGRKLTRSCHGSSLNHHRNLHFEWPVNIYIGCRC